MEGKSGGSPAATRGGKQEPQKNASQTSCSSAPLPSSALAAAGGRCPTPAPTRPRSLYAVHSYAAQQQQQQQQQPEDYQAGPAAFDCPVGECHGQAPSARFQRYGELAKYLEVGAAAVPASDHWPNHLSSIPSSLWRQSRSAPKPGHYYPQGPAPEDSCIYTAADHWRDIEASEPILGPLAAGHVGGAVTTPHGTISLRLHNKIRVDLSIDRAVRLINFKNNIVLSLSGSGSASALLHPNGRVFQYGSRVEILAHDVHGNNKYAKMWYKGVSFTSEQCALVYLVDAAGTRTTTDSFSNMSQDFSVDVFYGESRHGPACIQEAAAVLSTSQYWLSEEGVANWIINNVKISQTPDGLVRIARNSNKYQLRTSPSNGTASLTTPFLHCTASLGQTSHLFVRRGERRMHYDGTSFIVRNAGHSAGFDDNNQLKVY